MLAIARTTKLTATSKEKVEDETLEHVNASGSLGETELYGGERADEPENEGWCRDVASDVQLVARQIDSYIVPDVLRLWLLLAKAERAQPLCK